jgi:hypothetical protein
MEVRVAEVRRFIWNLGEFVSPSTFFGWDGYTNSGVPTMLPCVAALCARSASCFSAAFASARSGCRSRRERLQWTRVGLKLRVLRIEYGIDNALEKIGHARHEASPFERAAASLSRINWRYSPVVLASKIGKTLSRELRHLLKDLDRISLTRILGDNNDLPEMFAEWWMPWTS